MTTHGYKNHAVRTEEWRYIRYEDGSEELYNEKTDPHEWKNLSADSNYAAVKQELAKWLPANNAPTGGTAAEPAADAAKKAKRAAKKAAK